MGHIPHHPTSPALKLRLFPVPAMAQMEEVIATPPSPPLPLPAQHPGDAGSCWVLLSSGSPPQPSGSRLLALTAVPLDLKALLPLVS